MANLNRMIDDLEMLSTEEQDELAQRLLDRNSGLAVTLSTKINIAHQDKFYTNSEAMDESLQSRGHMQWRTLLQNI